MSIDQFEFVSARDRQGLQIHREALANRPRVGFQEALAESSAPGRTGRSFGPPPSTDSNFFGEDGFTFEDFLDLINPLQHLPIISTVYRAITGDQISQGSRIIGGALFGGPIGLATSVANAFIEQATGKDIGALALSIFEGDEELPEIAPAEPPANLLAQAAGLESGASRETASVAPLDTAAPETAAAHQTAGAQPDIPELSQDQLALLLSSVGLDPETAPRVARNAASPVQASTLASHPIRAGVPPVDIADAMSHALDKYQAVHALQASQRGGGIDRGL